MEIIKKLLCGSSELYKSIKGFTPHDTDYLLITDSDIVFEHVHPEDNVCWFVWGGDKHAVRSYLLKLPYYLTAMSIVTKEFITHYEFTMGDIIEILKKYESTYRNSTYRYYLPLFEHIKTKWSWDFPPEVINESYNLYKKYKKGR